MRLILTVFSILCLAIGYGCYRKGVSDGIQEKALEYSNDTNSDPSLKHSPSYDFAFIHGKAEGTIEGRQQAYEDCSDGIAKVAVRTGNVKFTAALLASNYVTLKSLREASNAAK
jgi:hypothetical protein